MRIMENEAMSIALDDLKEIPVEDKMMFFISNRKRTPICTFAIVLKENVDKSILNRALLDTLRVYPQYYYTTVIYDNDLYLVKNEEKVEVYLYTGTSCELGTAETNHYLFCVRYAEDTIMVTLSHGIGDGQVSFDFAKTLLYYYLTEKGHSIDTEGMIRIDPADSMNWTPQHDFERYRDPKATPFWTCKPRPVFNIREEAWSKDEFMYSTYRISGSLPELMDIVKRVQASPVPLVSSLISQAIYRCYDVAKEEQVVVHVPVDMRKMYQINSRNNFISTVYVPYERRCMDMPIDIQVTIARGIMDLQMQKENFDFYISQVSEHFGFLSDKNISVSDKMAYCNQGIEKSTSDTFTYFYTYVAAIHLPLQMQDLIKDIYFTTVPQDFPFGISMSTYEDTFSLFCSQSFKSDSLVRRMVDVFKEYGIDVTLENLGVFQGDYYRADRQREVCLSFN